MDKDHEFLMMLFNISKALRFCQQEEICGEGITFVQFNILNLIHTNGRLKMSELHEALAVDKSTTTRLVEPLVRQQMLIKEKSKEDSRVTILTITKVGSEVRNRAWECLKGFIASVEARIPAGKRQQVYESIQIYAAALRDSCCSCHCGQYIGRW